MIVLKHFGPANTNLCFMQMRNKCFYSAQIYKWSVYFTLSWTTIETFSAAGACIIKEFYMQTK